VEAVAGEVIQRYLREGNYAAARRVLDLWQNQFCDIAAQSALAWRQRFESAAGRQVADATQLANRRDYIGARRAVGRALAIWPSLATAEELMARIEREFPFVTVGVMETSLRQPVRRFDDWAALRTSALTQRLLAEQTDFGSEGGTYDSPYGSWVLDESGRELTLKLGDKLPPDAPTPDALARYLLSMAAPGSQAFRGDFAALVDGVSMKAEGDIVLHLKRVHVRPESLLQVPPSAEAAVNGPYRIADDSRGQTVFTANQPTGSRVVGPQAIVEQTLPDDDVALAALLAGEIDVLDRVPPWHLERLRAVQEVRVESYKLPTVHVLVPNLKKPLLAKREFRRALCFGIDRKWIVDRVLLGGGSLQGFEAISGPFPSGVTLNDPIRYAYNSQVLPRPFEPRLAAILATVAWHGVQNPPEKNKGKNDDKVDSAKKVEKKPLDTNLPELSLAHPSDPVARVACQSIQAQLAREGIPIKLLEFTADELLGGKVDCDLRYAELAVWEPIADARLILGPRGLAGDLQSAYLDAALRNLDTATNWKDVRARLGELHEIASHELPVIPLWQTVNYFAFRATIRGIGESPITLYQNVRQWSPAPRGNVARSDAVRPQ
jgi:ABC-type transport system substrate-binding protein